jgi:hypothetical protein
VADRYFELKSEIHRKLIGVINLEQVANIPKDRIRAEIGRVVERLLDEERLPMTTAEQNRIVEEVLDEVLGLGPLEPLLKEPTISDILVNGYNKIYVERQGKLSLTPVRFKDNAHLLHIIEKIVSLVGRRVDEANPIVDARLLDGSRVNAIISPLALDGPRALDPPLRPPRHHLERDDRQQHRHGGDAEVPLCGRAVQDDNSRVGRHRLRQDYDVERALALHPGRGAHHHHRGHGGTATPAAPCDQV